MMTRTRRSILLILLALPLYGLSVQAQETSGLQQRMTSDEFKAAGLDKLSPQELGNLDNWLRTHAKATTRVVDASGNPVFYTDEHSRHKITAHLAGHFEGWSGHSQFTLDNGQVWKQTDSDSPSCLSADKPAVKIKPSLMGNWLMFVDGCNGDAHVQRVH